MSMNLPTDVYSPDQVSLLTMDLRTYIDALRDTAVRASKGTRKATAQPETSPLVRSILEASPDSTPEELLKDLEALLKTAPIIHLTLAAMPSNDMKHQLVTWFRTQINPSTLVTFTQRRDIGGGVIVRAGSRLYDLSFKRRLLDNKQRIAELANSV